MLDHLNLHIRPGESVALVGHTGAGKSSIAKLIARFYEFQDGQLRIDGHDIRTFDLPDYRRHLGIVSQVPFLFSGTRGREYPLCPARQVRAARDPVAGAADRRRRVAGDPAAGAGHARWASAAAACPWGSANLVSLMRVLVQNPAIFILDEATASIDPFTEWQIQQALNLILQRATSILIAHRLSTVKAADRIIVLDHGAHHRRRQPRPAAGPGRALRHPLQHLLPPPKPGLYRAGTGIGSFSVVGYRPLDVDFVHAEATPMPSSFMRLLTLLTLVLPLLLSPQAGRTAEAHSTVPLAAAGTTRLRIGITADGIYRLTPSDLTLAGVALAAVDPCTFAMSSMGQGVAIRVEGEADGSFSGSDYVEFFGNKFHGEEQDEKYTDEGVYWLDMGGSPGPRITEVGATPEGKLTPPADFAAVVRAEVNNLWYTQNYRLDPPTKDSWFWDDLRPFASDGVTKTFPYTVPYPVAAAAATVWVDQNARSATAHHSEIGLNGLKLADVTWTAYSRSYVSAPVPPGLLTHGQNTLTARGLLTPEVRADWTYFNYWELHYRRLFRAFEGRLDFTIDTPGPHEYAVDGWQDGNVTVWDITDPASPLRLTGVQAAAGALGQTLRFQAADQAGSRYWLQQADLVLQPASIHERPPTGLRDIAAGADVVIVTAGFLRPAAERLAAWHVAHGRHPLVVDFLDVVDEFNDGVYHPRAVPAMLRWAQEHWPDPKPKYLVLFGDGHWNFKGYNLAAYPYRPNPIPPYLAWTDPDQGEVPADGWYADLDGDRRPDVAVGRIPVNDLEEANTVVAKIEGYDQTGGNDEWQRRTVFIADNPDDAGTYPLLSDAIIQGFLPPRFSAQRIYLGQTVPDATGAHDAILEAWNQGALMVQFAGHGATNRWTHEQIFTSNDIPGLQNGSRLPVVMTFNCLDGYFAFPASGNFAIAELLLRQPNGGAIAAISPSGLGYTQQQHRFREILMRTIFVNGVHELGEALLQAKRAYYDVAGPSNLVDTMTLFGDPTLRLPVASYPVYFPSLVRCTGSCQPGLSE